MFINNSVSCRNDKLGRFEHVLYISLQRKVFATRGQEIDDILPFFICNVYYEA